MDGRALQRYLGPDPHLGALDLEKATAICTEIIINEFLPWHSVESANRALVKTISEALKCL